MSRDVFQNGGVEIPFDDFNVPGMDVSWAGTSPNLKSLCFGSDDGKVVFAEDAQSELESGPPIQISPSREAINGVAGFEKWLAVSTRAEIVVFSLTLKKQ